jgi:hypothetical protein
LLDEAQGLRGRGRGGLPPEPCQQRKGPAHAFIVPAEAEAAARLH